MQSIVVLSVGYAQCHAECPILALYAGCQYAEYHHGSTIVNMTLQ
jgi:hypothetical protein